MRRVVLASRADERARPRERGSHAERRRAGGQHATSPAWPRWPLREEASCGGSAPPRHTSNPSGPRLVDAEGSASRVHGARCRFTSPPEGDLPSPLLEGTGGLHHQGHAAEAPVVQDPAERGQAQVALARACVPVHAAAPLALGVVEVHGLELVQAHGACEVTERGLVPAGAPDVVPRRTRDVSGRPPRFRRRTVRGSPRCARAMPDACALPSVLESGMTPTPPSAPSRFRGSRDGGQPAARPSPWGRRMETVTGFPGLAPLGSVTSTPALLEKSPDGSPGH